MRKINPLIKNAIIASKLGSISSHLSVLRIGPAGYFLDIDNTAQIYLDTTVDRTIEAINTNQDMLYKMAKVVIGRGLNK